MPSSRECLRRKGATTQSCFVFKVNSELAPEVSGRTLRSYYEASIEMGVRDLTNFRMVQWTIPVPSVRPSGIDVLGFPCEGNSTALQRAPCLSSQTRRMLCSGRLMASSWCLLSTRIKVKEWLTFQVVEEAVGSCCSYRNSERKEKRSKRKMRVFQRKSLLGLIKLRTLCKKLSEECVP